MKDYPLKVRPIIIDANFALGTDDMNPIVSSITHMSMKKRKGFPYWGIHILWYRSIDQIS